MQVRVMYSLPEETKQKIEKLAKELHWTKSMVVQIAVNKFDEQIKKEVE